MDIQQPFFHDDGLALPPAEPFPERRAEQHEESSDLTTQDSTGSEYVQAPQVPRRIRRPRKIPTDRDTQIRNSELQSWNDDYLANMAEARQQKANLKGRTQSKRNAANFVLDSGLGGVGINPGLSAVPAHPLAHLFAGQALLNKLRPPFPAQREKKGRSRSPTSQDTSDSEARRKRQHLLSDTGSQLGRGDAHHHGDISFGGGGGGDDDSPDIDANASIEIARQGVSLLEDLHSSQMPWNISSRLGSRAGSAHPSRQGSLQGSAQRLPGLPPSAGSLDRRVSRLPSPSLHVERRSGSVATDILRVGIGSSSSAGGVGDTGMLLGSPTGDVGGEEDSALREFRMDVPDIGGAPGGHGAELQTQTQGTTASTMQWESENFLAFVGNAIEEKKKNIEGAAGQVEEGEGEGEGGGAMEVSFEELLAPGAHKRAVAAAAFLHVLGLANKGALKTQQDVGIEKEEWWAPIWLGIAEGQGVREGQVQG